MNNGLSLLKIVGGLSKTIGVARQLIPIYKQVKPILNNSGKILSNINNFSLNKDKKEEKNNLTPVKQEIISNNPTFFQ